jgi:glycosyltransferase involved in cell wall biosynthesis
MANVHCLVFEPDVTGHHLHHVRHLTDALLEIGCDVTLALQSDCRSRAEYDVHLKALEPHVRLCARLEPRQRRNLAGRRRRVSELLDVIRDVKPAWVYGPYMDGITQAATVESLLRGSAPFRRVPIEVQLMRGKYAYPAKSTSDALHSAVVRWLTLRNPWYVTHMLDPLVLGGLEPLPHGNRFRLIPEPVEPFPEVDRTEARRTLGVPTDGRYLAVVGGLLPWKGIGLLLGAFSRAKLGSDDRLLMVGKMHPEIHEMVHGDHGDLLRKGRIVTVPRYVSDFELDCGILASDVVAATYPGATGSAGAVVRAAAARRPVLGTDCGWIGWATTTFHLGTTVDVANADEYAAVIEKVLDGAGSFRQSEKGGRFCKYHTVANQQAHWVQTLGHDRGVPLGRFADRVDWNWVCNAE